MLLSVQYNLSYIQKQFKKQISEVQAKKIEFQNHQKFTDNLLRISNEAAKSSEKEINKIFNEMIAILEAQRAQLLAEVHSIHESEVKQIAVQSESVACSLSCLSGSIQFTKQLLDNGDDVEIAVVSDQTAQTLSSLIKMTWNKRMLQSSLLRTKFESIKEAISSFGKVSSRVELSDITFSNMPVDAVVEKESSCEVYLLDEISKRGYEATLKITVSHSDTSVLKSTAVTVTRKSSIRGWYPSCQTNLESTKSKYMLLGTICHCHSHLLLIRKEERDHYWYRVNSQSTTSLHK